MTGGAVIPQNPEDYEEIVAQAARETERRYAPPLAAMVPNITAYDCTVLAITFVFPERVK
jgi:hypothetical protein